MMLLKGGTIVDPSQKLKRKLDLLVDKGKIASLGKIQAQYMVILSF